jgi:bifunctional DNase/RNase
MAEEESVGEEFLTFRVTEVVSVTVALPETHAQVQLSETEAPYRVLAFPVGLTEGAALAAAIEGSVGARPTTHELFAEVLGRTGVEVIALRLTRRDAGVLCAEIDLMGPRGREIVECRPSDGLVLCHRQMVTAPILVAEGLLVEEV